MGGLLALQLCLLPDCVDLLCVSAAMLQNAVAVSGALTAVASLLAKRIPDAPIQALDANALAFAADVVAKYQHDPWVYHGKVRAALGYGLLTEGQAVLEQASQLSLATLIMHGEHDTIADPAGSQRLYEQLASKDKTFKLFDGKHEILNDRCRFDVLDVFSHWLDQHI
jgi:alpha-beta hydrolase superfamily lysophospholipase